MKSRIVISDKWYRTEKEKKLAHKLIEMEDEALARFFDGDMSGYRELWSSRNFTYFDANTEKRVENLDELDGFLNGLEGFMKAKWYRIEEPRIQFSNDCDMAILTYQLFADTNIADLAYNVIEVFRKEEDRWHVAHSTWSFIKPMDIDWAHFRKI